MDSTAFGESADIVFAIAPDSTIVLWNHTAEAVLGYRAEEVLGQPCWSIMKGHDAEFRPLCTPDCPVRAQVRRGETPRSFTLQAETKTGARVWLDISVVAAPNCPSGDGTVIHVARDVTELQEERARREQAERDLRESETRYRLLAENVTDVIFVYDLSLRPVYVSPSVARLRGYSAEEALRQTMAERLTPASLEVATQALAEELAAERSGSAEPGRSRVLELEVRCKDGTTVWTETGFSFLRDARGQPSGIIGVSRDITARKRMEAEQAQIEEQLRQAQKMEAVGRLAGGIAHEFNNLMTVVGGRSELLLRRANLSEDGRRDVEIVRTTAARAASLTRQLLAFGRKQILRPKVLDVNAIVDGLTAMLRPVLPEDIRLVFVPDPELGRVVVDPHQLEQVVLNLALNARDAMPAGGLLTLETANVEVSEPYARGHPDVEPGSYVLLAVSDTGIGMDAETRSKIFEPFFTTKKLGEGTGLGLATVYGIVMQSGGHVTVASEPGQGSSFRVYLPRTQEPAPTAEPVPGVERGARGAETILLAEDDDDVRRMARDILDDQGYRVLDARDSREAVSVAACFAGRIQLLLTDVVMPHGNGFQLAEELRRVRPDIKVLFMSGYTGSMVLHRGVFESGNAFIEKPFTVTALAAKVRAALDG